MKFTKTSLSGVLEIDLEPFADERGWFARTYCEKEFEAAGLQSKFVQFNHSFNERAGTFRGFHYQVPPHAETKLIRCISGSVMDIVIDLRRGSPTFLKSIQVKLSAENKKMILIPEGFAHGFITLEENSALLYHHTEFYHIESEQGISL
jgi:dTDP-4-dehydrorhamnose 3,5-epimerase